MTQNKKKYKNSLSITFGLLCLVINFLHAGWIGGFNSYTLGFDANTPLGKIISLTLATATPSFFILWGYLSSKYFESDETGFSFLKSKILQFYPIYLVSFVVNYIFRYEYMQQFDTTKLILTAFGLNYEQGIGGGGNVYFVIFWVTITVSLFKSFRLKGKSVVAFTIGCLAIAKFLPHESSFCYVQYFGYYAAYFFGASLKKIDFFKIVKSSPVSHRLVLCFIATIAVITPMINFIGSKALEIQYSPNSPEQLCFAVIVLFVTNRVFDKLNLAQSDFWLCNVLNRIGNNTYGHFLIHAHLVRLAIYVNTYLMLNALLLQVLVVLFVSYISVFWILPPFRKWEAVVVNKLFVSRSE